MKTYSYFVNPLQQKWMHIFLQNKIIDPYSSTKWLALNVNFNALANNFQFSEYEASQFDLLCQRRLKHEPIQYICGDWEFCGLNFYVEPPTLIFRPETEILVKIIQEYYHERESFVNFLEFGCGSGVISASILYHFKGWNAMAIDISSHSIALTKMNCEKIGVNDRLKHLQQISIKEFDVKQCLIQTYLGTESNVNSVFELDFIVSNPPYVMSHEMAELSADIIEYEDQRALDGGEYGLDVVQDIFKQSSTFLNPGKQIWLELHDKHCEVLDKILIAKKNGNENSNPYCDAFSQNLYQILLNELNSNAIQIEQIYLDFNNQPKFVRLSVS